MQLCGVTADLGEQQAALEQRHGSGRQLTGVGVDRETPARLHTLEAIAQVCLPALEGVGQGGAGERVALGELTNERSDGAAPARLALLLESHQGAEPAVDAGPGIEVIEQLVRVMMESLHIQRFRQLWRDLEVSLAPAKPERVPRLGPRLAASNSGGREPHAVEIASANKPASREMQTEIHGE